MPPRIVAMRRSRALRDGQAIDDRGQVEVEARHHCSFTPAGRRRLLRPSCRRVVLAPQIDVEDVLLTLAPDHLVEARHAHLLEAPLALQRRLDRLRLRDGPYDPVDGGVLLLDIELLDVVHGRRRDILRELHHHVESVGVRHRVVPRRSPSLGTRSFLRVGGAGRLLTEHFVGHGAEGRFERRLILVRGVQLRVRREEEAHDDHRGKPCEHRDLLAHPGKPALEGERPAPQIEHRRATREAERRERPPWQ